VLQLDPAVRAERDPRVVTECDAELAIAAGLEPVLLIHRHAERSGVGSRAVDHRRGSRHRLDIADRHLVGPRP